MICAYCKSDIDNDSYHCDQCGKELFICSTCGKPGKGKNCVEDGGKLYSPKQQNSTTDPSETPGHNDSSSSAEPVSLLGSPISASLPLQPPVLGSDSSNPVLKLINNHLNIEVELKSGDIIGRTKGNHANIFQQFTQISGQHAQFLLEDSGWAIKDLGSTNGSAVNSSPDWQNVPKLTPQASTPLSNNTFLLIANIEFQVKVIDSSTPTGTQRL